jgi:NADPH:quinone reductase-like Zn-dependent oxidoreductase
MEARMKAIIVRRPGFAEPEEGADGRPPAPGRVRVRVRYAGVGWADVMAVRGGYPLAPRRPFSPGYEFYGTVEEAGDPGGAGRSGGGFAPGTRVLGLLPRMGAYREFVDVDARLAAPVPDSVGDETAALLPLNYLTAFALITRLAALEKGQSFFIHGAAGGVGTAALELARILGLKAYGTASIEKHCLVSSLGGLPLARKEDSWMGELARSEPGGVDAAFDSFGVPSFRKSWKILKPGGILACYGLAPSLNGGPRDFLAGLLWAGAKNIMAGGKRVRICSVPGLMARDPLWFRPSLERILAWAASGALNPVSAGIHEWRRVAEAHRELAEGRMRGKLLLDFSR